jgi:hypothetical protein
MLNQGLINSKIIQNQENTNRLLHLSILQFHNQAILEYQAKRELNK